MSLFALSLHVNVGGGRLLDAHPDGPGVAGYPGMDGPRALVIVMRVRWEEGFTAGRVDYSLRRPV